MHLAWTTHAPSQRAERSRRCNRTFAADVSSMMESNGRGKNMTLRISLAALLLAALALGGLAVRAAGGPTGAEASPPGPATDAEVSSDAQEGTVVATDDGRFFFLWNGGKHRIQQPAAFDEADLAGLGLQIGRPAPRVLEVGEEPETRFGTRFVMVPADGPEARLHLLRGSSLHLLDIVRVDASTVAAMPDLTGTVIDRVTFR